MNGPEPITDKTPDQPSSCRAETTLEFLSGKWRPMIIYWLLKRGSVASTSFNATLAQSLTERCQKPCGKWKQADCGPARIKARYRRGSIIHSPPEAGALSRS